MVVKRRRFETRTVLIVLSIILIIIAVYILITNLPVNEEYLTPEVVANNIQQYLNKSIIVEGYYEPDIEEGSIVSKPIDQMSGPPTSWLRIDVSNLDNASLPLFTDVKYHFTGTVKQLDIGSSPTPVYKLFVEKVDRV
jgi:hypothetical protein